ncbi:MAG: tetratricopeptide repeat protein [Fimbriimonadaceae bacterium]
MQDENQEELTSESPETEEEARSDAEDEIIPDDPEKVEHAERTLREANLARVRGHMAIADRLLREAADMAPNTASVLEAVGDNQVANGRYRDAKLSFARAHKIDPQSKSIENKYGEMVLKVDLNIDPFAHAEAFDGYASPKIAVTLSLLCPGLGQFAVERYTKGGIMIAVYAVTWVLMGLLPGGFKSVFGFMTGKAAFDPLGGLLLLIALGVIVWSVADLGSLKNKAPRKIERPLPPMDGY